MNNAAKTLLLLVVVIIIIILIGLWAKLWLGNQRQGGGTTTDTETAVTLFPDIPEELSEVAEEEYAIEFEVTDEPAAAIDTQFCNFVREQCEKQGIKDCEDYKMCVAGVDSNK